MTPIGRANAALTAAIVFLLVSTCAAYIAFARLNVAEGWVRHAHAVQSAIANLDIELARAGRLRAEFVDSGDSEILERQTEAVQQARDTMVEIRHLTIDNPEQQATCSRLEEQVEHRIALMDSAISLKKSGKSTLATQAPISTQMVAAAQATDVVGQRMYEAESGLLILREERARRLSLTLTSILVGSLLMGLILFLIHHRLLIEEVRARATAEAAQRALSSRLLTLQDEERRKFARELHDSVGQNLAALKMYMTLMQSRLPDDSSLRECMKLLDDSLAETRTISHLLHPPLLDEAGLVSACSWFVEGFAKRSGIDVKFENDMDSERLPPTVELVLFRALQESLTNVHRHAGAKKADVTLKRDGRDVVLRVKDYGQGFDVNSLQSFQQDGAGAGVGLAGMRERVREINGQIEINSNGNGTEVVVRVRVPRGLKKVPPAADKEVVRE